MARQLILGTAGHIDHGKTQLVIALTGTDTDRLPEERARGMTIDLGFARLDLGDYQLGIVDMPGHERFIKNMLAGASGVDVAMLVVAADDGVMPQTREHLALLELLDVRYGMVAISKCDLVEPAWLEMVQDDVRQLVAGTFMQAAPIVRTAAPQGVGIDALKSTLQTVCGQVKLAPPGELFRLAVDRSFVVAGRGTVVTGTIWQGEVCVDDQAEWLPAQRPLRVRSIESHGRAVSAAQRGQRAAVALGGVHHRDIRRGHELATPGYLIPAKRLTISMRVLDSSPWPIKHRARLRLHLGAGEHVASVALLGRHNVVQPGEQVKAQLHLTEPVTAICGQPFILRAESPLLTIGGGHVLQPSARLIKRKDTDAIARLTQLQSSDAAVRAAAAIGFFVTHTWTTLDLCRDARLDRSQCEAVVDQLTATGQVIRLAVSPSLSQCVHRDVVNNLEQRMTEAIAHYHQQHPLDAAITREHLCGKLGHVADEPLLQAVLERMAKAGRIISDAHGVASAGFSPKLSPSERVLRDRVLEAYRAAGFSPPDVKAIADDAAVTSRAAQQIINLCVTQGKLVHVGGGMYLHTEWEQRMCRTVMEMLHDQGSLTVSQIKDALGTSRKFAVPLCEYLDRMGYTKRQGNLRVPGRMSKSTMGRDYNDQPCDLRS